MTAKIISVFNQKGGCAKSTSTVQLAGTLGLRGYKVFVIDMDPQNTSALWALAATDTPFPAEILSFAPLGEHFVEKVKTLVERFDILIIDNPPAVDSRVPWASLLISDLAIIPCIPVMDNIWASRQAEDLVERAQKENPSLQATYLMSMVRRGNVFDQCLTVLEQKAKLPIMKTKIAMRNAYPESQIFGCVVGQFGNSPAAKEQEALVDEVIGLLGIKLKKRVNKL